MRLRRRKRTSSASFRAAAPAAAGGTLLQILVPEGLVVTAGTPLAVIGQPGESVPVAAVPMSVQAGHAVAAPTMTGPAPAPRISPVVAKIAAEYGVNLQQVQGTGMNGRITKNDVLNFVENGGSRRGASRYTNPVWGCCGWSGIR